MKKQSIHVVGFSNSFYDPIVGFANDPNYPLFLYHFELSALFLINLSRLDC